MNNTKLAIVGRGYWGSIYVNTINQLKNVTLSQELIMGRDYQKKLKENTSDIQGIIVATPPETHFEVASYLLKNGYPNLLIEKPLTDNIATASQLLEIQKSNPNAILMVGHVHLYDPAYSVMKKFAKKNLGNIKQIIYTSLKSKPVENSTVLKHLSPHPLSIFLDLVNAHPTKIEAHETKYDNIELNIEFSNGVLGTAIMGTTYPERKREMEIVGEKGKLYLNEFLNPRELVFTNLDNKAEKLEFSGQSALEMQINEFVNCINSGNMPKTILQQGFEVVKIIDLALNSIEKGSPITYS